MLAISTNTVIVYAGCVGRLNKTIFHTQYTQYFSNKTNKVLSEVNA